MRTYVHYINAHAKPNYLQTEIIPRHSGAADAVTRCESFHTKLLSSPRRDPMSLRTICSAVVYARAEHYCYCRDYYFVLSSSLIIRNCIQRPLLKYNNSGRTAARKAPANT